MHPHVMLLQVVLRISSSALTTAQIAGGVGIADEVKSPWREFWGNSSQGTVDALGACVRRTKLGLICTKKFATS